jgi:hypothetical protein
MRRIGVYISDDLRERIAAQAELDKRRATAETIVLIEEALQARERRQAREGGASHG